MGFVFVFLSLAVNVPQYIDLTLGDRLSAPFRWIVPFSAYPMFAKPPPFDHPLQFDNLWVGSAEPPKKWNLTDWGDLPVWHPQGVFDFYSLQLVQKSPRIVWQRLVEIQCYGTDEQRNAMAELLRIKDISVARFLQGMLLHGK